MPPAAASEAALPISTVAITTAPSRGLVAEVPFAGALWRRASSWP